MTPFLRKTGDTGKHLGHVTSTCPGFSCHVPREIAAWAVSLYQKIISPLFPPVCRYHPTCSEYFRQSLLKKGLLRGALAGAIRILRCNPFFRGGHDPVE